eukprot:scaffold4229_cov30-Tisochrysis_lutea.AAC.16
MLVLRIHGADASIRAAQEVLGGRSSFGFQPSNTAAARRQALDGRPAACSQQVHESALGAALQQGVLLYLCSSCHGGKEVASYCARIGRHH